MSRANTSSVDTDEGFKIAHMGKQQKLATLAKFEGKGSAINEQIINANKKATLNSAKAKAKRKAKLAKQSRKKNKK